MAVSYRGRISGGGTASTTTLTQTATGGINAGDVCILLFVANSAGSGFAAPTVSDSFGDTYTAILSSNTSGAPQFYVFTTTVAQNVTSGNNLTITISCAANAQNYGWTADFFGGITAAGIGGVARSGGTSTTPSATATPDTRPCLIWAPLTGNFTSAQTFTEDTDTVGGSWVSMTGYFNSSAQSNIRGAYKINSTGSTAQQTYNPTLGTSVYWNAAMLFLPIIQTPSTSDTAAMSDLNATSIYKNVFLSTSDATPTFSDVSSDESQFVPTSDLAIQSEQPSSLSAGVLTSDAPTLTESSRVSPSTSDLAGVSDSSSLYTFNYLATSDLASGSDSSATTATVTTSDLATESDASSPLNKSFNTSDLATQSEASSSTSTNATSDLASGSDSSVLFQGSAVPTATDATAVVSESSSVVVFSATSDLATTGDSSTESTSRPTSDLAALTDSRTSTATLTTTDAATTTDTSNAFSSTPVMGLENPVVTDSSSATASVITSDLAGVSDISVRSTMVPTTDSATQTETSFIAIKTSDLATFTEARLISLSTSDVATTTDKDVFGQFISDNATTTEQRNSGPLASELFGFADSSAGGNNYIYTADLLSFTDSLSIFYPFSTSDDAFSFTEASVEFTKPRITEDPIYYPVEYRVNKDFRIIAQDHFTRKFIHWDLPIDNVSITYTLTGPNLLHGTMSTRMEDMATLDPPLMPDRTWLHVEEDGEIRGSFILTPFVDNPQTQTRSIEAEGFSAYPHWLTYQGDAYVGIQVDPADMIRKIWDHLQSYPDGNLNVTVGGMHTPVKIGEPPENVSFTTSAGVNVSFQGGPYTLNYWAVTNLGSEIEKLCKETPIDYLEYSKWNDSKTDVQHMLLLGYPRMGTRRNDLAFREGENLAQLIPSYQGTNENYASEVIVIGAGTGPTAIRAIRAGRIGLLRKTNVIQNQEIVNVKRAQSIANFEFNRIAHSRFLIQSVLIDMTHINAPWGSFSPGDDILVECNVDYVGYVQDYYRITSYTYDPYLKVASLALAPSDSFTYGAENFDAYSQLPTAGYATLATVQDYSTIGAPNNQNLQLSQLQGYVIQYVQISSCQYFNTHFVDFPNGLCIYWYWIKSTPDSTHILPQINVGYGFISDLVNTNNNLIIGKTEGGYIITGTNIVLIAKDGTIGQLQNQQSDVAYPNPYYVPSQGSGQTQNPTPLQFAAQQIINRITSGQSYDNNLNWPGAPYEVFQYGNYLVSQYLNYRNMPLIQFLAAVVNGQIK